MANPSLLLVDALRRTVRRMEQGSAYQWGHMGACNCGNLAQELTQHSKASIHEYAMRGHGDWSEQLNDYCPVSGAPLDFVISDMLNAGLEVADLKHLEYVSDPKVLARFPLERRNAMRKNKREDVIAYLSEWANLLEEQLLASIQLPAFDWNKHTEKVSR